MNPRWLLLLTIAPIGCAARVEKSVLNQAAIDFECTAGDLKVKEYPALLSRAPHYRVHGCEKTQIYAADCSLFACRATTARGLNLAKPAPDPDDVKFTSDDPDIKAAEARPSKFSVFNRCGELVFLLVGKNPQTFGRPDNVDKNGLREIDLMEGDTLWIVEPADSQKGLDHITVSSKTTREIYIDETCRAFVPAQ